MSKEKKKASGERGIEKENIIKLMQFLAKLDDTKKDKNNTQNDSYK